MRRLFVSIDANIGAGKTSCIRVLKSKYGVNIDLEPVEEWAPDLKNMYETKTGYFDFQKRVFWDRCGRLPRGSGHTVVERSPEMQRKVFIVANKENMSESEISELNMLYDQDVTWSPSVYIYLNASPETCISRIASRARDGEDAISFEYIRKLHNLHESALRSLKAPVIEVDVDNKGPEEVADEVYAHISRVFGESF